MTRRFFLFFFERDERGNMKPIKIHEMNKIKKEKSPPLSDYIRGRDTEREIRGKKGKIDTNI